MEVRASISLINFRVGNYSDSWEEKELEMCLLSTSFWSDKNDHYLLLNLIKTFQVRSLIFSHIASYQRFSSCGSRQYGSRGPQTP